MNTQDNPGSQSSSGVQTTQLTLDNGLQVILAPDDTASVAAVQFWVEVGSADERDKEYGLAHVHEHMLFKGTDTRPVGQISKEIEGAGGNINAFTSYDMTVYYTVLTHQAWKTGLSVLSDAMRNSSFDPDELSKELEVVLEEVRRGEDNSDRVLSQKLFATVFKHHAYKHPVIGYSEVIEEFSREGILDFYHRWYTPQNITLVLAGKFDVDEAKQEIESLLGDWQATDLPDRTIVTEPTQPEPRFEVIRFNTEEPKVGIAFPSVASDHKDAIALDVLSSLLSEGMNSVLFQQMRRLEDLAVDVDTYNYTPRHPGLFSFDAKFAADKLDSGLTKLMALAKSTEDWPYDESALQSIRNRLEADFVRSIETTSGLAHQLGSFKFYNDDPNYAAEYLDLVRAVTIEDVRRVATQYIKPELANIVLMLPVDHASTITAKELAAMWANAAVTSPDKDTTGNATAIELPSAPTGKTPLSIVSRDDKNGLTTAKLDNGLTVMILPVRRAPNIVIHTRFDGGVIAEQPGQEGWFQQLASLWQHGLGDLGPEQLETVHASLGGNTSAWTNRDGFGLNGWYLNRDVAGAINLYSSLLTQPALPADMLELNRSRILQHLSTLKDNLFRYGLRHFLSEWYGDQSYGHLSEGTPAAVQSVSRDDLVALHSQFVRPDGAYMSIAGDIDVDEVLSQLQKSLAGWEGKADFKTTPITPKITTAKEVVVPIEKEQSHLWWAFPGLSLNDPDRTTLDVADTMLSGMGGRLFMRLRDELSLAYVVTSINVSAQHPGFFVYYIAGSPDKEAQAWSEFEKQIDMLVNDQAPADEVERAKRYLIGTSAIGLERPSSLASTVARGARYFGDPLYYQQFADRVNAVDAAAIQRVAARLMNKDKALRMTLRSQAAQ